MNTALNVSKWFLKKEAMTQKKIQKLVYYSQAWSYALRNEPMVNEKFEAWVHGPVCPSLYPKYADYKFSYIPQNEDFEDLGFSSDEVEILESVWETYGDLTGNALEALSHTELPWIKARGNCEPLEICKKEISTQDMRNYYQSIYIGDSEEQA